MERKIKIAGFVIGISGDNFCRFIASAGRAFGDFLTDEDADFSVTEDLPDASIAPYMNEEALYEISFEGIDCRFGRSGGQIWFTSDGKAASESHLLLWRPGDTTVHATSSICSPTLTRFALWMAVNMLLVGRKCAAVHSSVNVSGGSAVMCLGESGTGKSTHTRLLRENYPDSFLLNDDSPFVRAFEDGRIMVYGSPWSGKTPCYKQLAFPLKAVIRLSQAPYNRIRALSPLQAIGAVQPSLPPAFNYDEEMSDMSCALVSDIVSNVRFYHLECLPDDAAARLSYSTVFDEK